MEVYEVTHVLIPVYITEDVVESVAQKLSGSAGPSRTNLEALQGYLLKLGDHSRKLCFNVKYYVAFLAKTNHHGPLLRNLFPVAWLH